MIHEEVHCISKECLEVLIHTHVELESICGKMILRVRNNDGRNIKLDLADFHKMNLLSRESEV